MLGKLCHIVLSHPTRNLAFLWASLFHLQLDDPELMGSGAEGSSLPQSVIIRSACQSFSNRTFCCIEFCTAKPGWHYSKVWYGSRACSDSLWGAWGGKTNRAAPQAAQLLWLLCVKGISLSHLWEDSNQSCKTSSQILFRLRSMLGWSSDNLLKASFILFSFRSTKGALLASFGVI